MKEKIARGVGLISDPRFTAPLIFLLIASKTSSTFLELNLNLFLVFLIDFFLPLGIFFLFWKRKLIPGWDLDKKEQRPLLFLTIVVLSLLGISLFYYFRSYFLFKLNLILLIGFFLATIVTNFWKISMHMLINTLMIIFLNFTFGGPVGLWRLYFLLPIIAWSRHTCGKHNWKQLLAGFLLAISCGLVGMKIPWNTLTKRYY